MPATVLIADVNKSTREILGHILKDCARLFLAASPAEGLDILIKKDLGPMTAFFGVHDPKGPDTAIFARIRSLFPSLKLIAIADHCAEKHTLEAVRQGASGYIIRPFPADAVLSTVLIKNIS